MFILKVEAHPVHTFKNSTIGCIYHDWFSASPTDWVLRRHIFLAEDIGQPNQSQPGALAQWGAEVLNDSLVRD
jgi:hypothetical protein